MHEMLNPIKRLHHKCIIMGIIHYLALQGCVLEEVFSFILKMKVIRRKSGKAIKKRSYKERVALLFDFEQLTVVGFRIDCHSDI